MGKRAVLPLFAGGMTLGIGLVVLVGSVIFTPDRKAAQPLSIRLTQPPSGERFESPADIPIEAEAESSNRPVRVDFYHGPIKIGEAHSAPYRCVWKGLRYPGIYEVTAQAVGARGDVAESQRVWVMVDRPDPAHEPNE